jgi:hypothetical protein
MIPASSFGGLNHVTVANLNVGRRDVSFRGKARKYLLYRSITGHDPGCVKTVEAVVSAQEQNQTCGFGESFMRERQLVRINLATARSAG